MVPAPLPDLDALDPEALKALVIVTHNESVRQHQQLSSKAQEIEHLKLVIEKYRRMNFGRKSEKLTRELEQLELRLEELESTQVKKKRLRKLPRLNSPVHQQACSSVDQHGHVASNCRKICRMSYRSRRLQARSWSPLEDGSLAETLRDTSQQCRIGTALSGDVRPARQLDMDRAVARRLLAGTFNRLRHSLDLSRDRDRQQSRRSACPITQLVLLEEAPPLEYLVRVHSMCSSNLATIAPGSIVSRTIASFPETPPRLRLRRPAPDSSA